MSRDVGAGSPLALALIGGLAALTMLVIPLVLALSVRQAVAGAADAAALAAADTASGLLPGFPCESASRVSAANGFTLTECGLDGLVATVRVGTAVLGIPVSAAATAGPPPG